MGGRSSPMYKKPLRERSALVYILVSLIPYSKPNLLLSYKPSRFYWELEKISGYKNKTLHSAYRRGVRTGLIKEYDKIPKLTDLGRFRVAPFVATVLGNEAKLMVIFDIPESESKSRKTFRNILRNWSFEQVQKSVWVSEKDFREPIAEVIDQLELAEYVEIHESARLFPA